MDFAKKQLEKYGWTEGKGLGKSEDGIQTALKPIPKHGSGGLGHDLAEEFTNQWWHKIYNSASNNIEVKVKDNGEIDSFTTKDGESIEIGISSGMKNRKKNNAELNKRRKKRLYTESFIQQATLINGVEDKSKIISDSDSLVKKYISSEIGIKKLTDEELFAACGGRTAHKGARHGLKCNGKLQRIVEQEEKYKNTQKNYNIAIEKCAFTKSASMSDESSNYQTDEIKDIKCK